MCPPQFGDSGIGILQRNRREAREQVLCLFHEVGYAIVDLPTEVDAGIERSLVSKSVGDTETTDRSIPLRSMSAALASVSKNSGGTGYQ